MKEKIYTIPITESFEQDCECPLCYLENCIENDAVNYALGAAMMEPDYRLISNEKGYCIKHFSYMLASENKLSLALLLDTHVDEVMKKLSKCGNGLTSEVQKKGGLFKKSSLDRQETPMLECCDKLLHSCVICDKINDEMTRYIGVFFYMWDKDEGFRKKVLSSKGFCLKHFNSLISQAAKELKNPDSFIKQIYDLESENLNRIKEDIHRFTLKFDYRNKDMPWNGAEDAPVRTIEKLQGGSIPIKKDDK